METPPPEKKIPTTSLSLPAELRNSIYALALVQHDPITLIRSTDQGDEYSTSPFSTGPDILRPGQPKPPLAVLRANQQIHSEAAPVFYGANTFHAVSEKVLKEWMEGIAGNMKHLRGAGLHASMFFNATGVGYLKLLQLAGDLQSLTLFRHLHRGGGSMAKGKDEVLVRRTAKLLVPLLRALKGTRKGNVAVAEGGRDVEDLMEIVRFCRPGGANGAQEERYEWERDPEEFQKG